MPETNKREYTAQSTHTPTITPKRAAVKSGAKFPEKPAMKVGQYECTAAGKTRRSSF